MLVNVCVIVSIMFCLLFVSRLNLVCVSYVLSGFENVVYGFLFEFIMLIVLVFCCIVVFGEIVVVCMCVVFI